MPAALVLREDGPVTDQHPGYVPQARETDYGTFWVTTEILEKDGRFSGVYRVATLVGGAEAEVSRWFWTEDEAEREILRLRALDDAAWAAEQAARARQP